MDQKQSHCVQEMDRALRELMTSPTGRRSFVKAMPLLLAACATGPQSRYREGDNKGQGSALTVEEEKQLTAEALPKMRQDYPPVPDAQLQGFINTMGQKIVAANGLRANPYNYTFTVVDVDYINAFALPAGTVMVTAPLIAAAETEAELAGVVGHEIGHIQARHTAERMFTAKKQQSKGWLYGLGGGVLGAALGFGIGKMICAPRDKACLTKAATYGGGAGAMGGMLIQKYAFMQNSQEDEMEADRIGFKTAHKAGYHKDYVGKFYEKLLDMEKQRQGGGSILAPFADALSTHPPSQNRVNQMRQMASQARGSGEVSGQAFKGMQQRAKSFGKKKG